MLPILYEGQDDVEYKNAMYQLFLLSDEDTDGYLNFNEYKKLMRLSILAFREQGEKVPQDLEN